MPGLFDHPRLKNQPGVPALATTHVIGDFSLRNSPVPLSNMSDVSGEIHLRFSPARLVYETLKQDTAEYRVASTGPVAYMSIVTSRLSLEKMEISSAQV